LQNKIVQRHPKVNAWSALILPLYFRPLFASFQLLRPPELKSVKLSSREHGMT